MLALIKLVLFINFNTDTLYNKLLLEDQQNGDCYIVVNVKYKGRPYVILEKLHQVHRIIFPEDTNFTFLNVLINSPKTFTLKYWQYESLKLNTINIYKYNKFIANRTLNQIKKMYLKGSRFNNSVIQSKIEMLYLIYFFTKNKWIVCEYYSSNAIHLSISDRYNAYKENMRRGIVFTYDEESGRVNKIKLYKRGKLYKIVDSQDAIDKILNNVNFLDGDRIRKYIDNIE